MKILFYFIVLIFLSSTILASTDQEEDKNTSDSMRALDENSNRPSTPPKDNPVGIHDEVIAGHNPIAPIHVGSIVRENHWSGERAALADNAGSSLNEESDDAPMRNEGPEAVLIKKHSKRFSDIKDNLANFSRQRFLKHNLNRDSLEMINPSSSIVMVYLVSYVIFANVFILKFYHAYQSVDLFEITKRLLFLWSYYIIYMNVKFQTPSIQGFSLKLVHLARILAGFTIYDLLADFMVVVLKWIYGALFSTNNEPVSDSVGLNFFIQLFANIGVFFAVFKNPILIKFLIRPRYILLPVVFVVYLYSYMTGF